MGSRSRSFGANEHPDGRSGSSTAGDDPERQARARSARGRGAARGPARRLAHTGAPGAAGARAGRAAGRERDPRLPGARIHGGTRSPMPSTCAVRSKRWPRSAWPSAACPRRSPATCIAASKTVMRCSRKRRLEESDEAAVRRDERAFPRPDPAGGRQRHPHRGASSAIAACHSPDRRRWPSTARSSTRCTTGCTTHTGSTIQSSTRSSRDRPAASMR